MPEAEIDVGDTQAPKSPKTDRRGPEGTKRYSRFVLGGKVVLEMLLFRELASIWTDSGQLVSCIRLLGLRALHNTSLVSVGYYS